MEEKVDLKITDKYKALFDEFLIVANDYGVMDDLGIPTWVIFPEEKEDGYTEAIEFLKNRIKEIKKVPPYARAQLKPSHEIAASIVTSIDVKNYTLSQITSANKHRLELSIRSEFHPSDYSKLKNIASYYGYHTHLSEVEGYWFITFNYSGHSDYKPKFKRPIFD